MNAPIQSEQVDETCGSGRVVLYLESLGMSAFFEIISNRQGAVKIYGCRQGCRQDLCANLFADPG